MKTPQLQQHSPSSATEAACRFQRLVEHLKNPALYDHFAKQISVLETHISTVLLVGDYAYKLKKPYNLGFLDFTTLEARHYYCEEELRLNRRLAPNLYMSVVAITGSVDAPHFDGKGKIIEYAVKMRRFPQENLLLNVLQRGELHVEQLDRLAQRIATFHAALPAAVPNQDFGEPDSLHAATRQNFTQIAPLIFSAVDRAQLDRLAQLSEDLFARTLPIFLQRKQQGFIRECHGDLHLGNMVLIDGEIAPFDCIEFNVSFRWNDVMSEIAFVVMDLASRGRPDLGFHFLNSYLEQTGDFSGLQVLRYYLMFRAVVRAKIAAILASEADIPSDKGVAAWQDFHHYLDLAVQFSHTPPFLLVLMHGPSGSGKSTVARDLATQLSAIHARSDVERKRLYGFSPLAHTDAQPNTGIYTQEATQRTYARLMEITLDAQSAGYAVVLDATFLSTKQRAPFLALSDNTWIVSCEAPEEVLRNRVRSRYQAGTDAAEANLAVLEQQLAMREGLSEIEMQRTTLLNTQQPFDVHNLSAQLLQKNMAKLPQIRRPC